MTVAASQEEPELASDQLDYIQRVVDYLQEETNQERLSWNEISIIQSLYETAKLVGEDDFNEQASSSN